MASTLSWIPDEKLLEELIYLATQKGESLDSIITEVDPDPLLGLFKDSPDLAT